jgi:hypothetical protein
MNESEMNPEPQPINLQTDLMDQVVALRHQVFTLLLALVVVSGTLTVYLYRQASVAKKDLTAVKPQATQMIEEFKRVHPTMDTFVKQLTAYGVTHPDFQPILRKYGIVPQNQAGPTPVAPGAPAAPATPAVPAVPKK